VQLARVASARGRCQAEFDHVDAEIEHGGMVFFAVDDGTALASCAVFNRQSDGWESTTPPVLHGTPAQ
jgi:hypothetical protein